MNGVDIIVVILVSLFVALLLIVRFIIPKLINRKLRKKGKDKNCECSKCNGIDCIVLGCLGVAVGIVILHLIHVYKKSPCGDCASAKQCRAFCKEKIIKAYKKECKLEKTRSKNI